MARSVAAGGERIGPKGLGKLLQAGVLFLAALNGGVAFGQGTTSQTDAANDAKTWAKGVSKSTYNSKTLITSGNVSATPTYTGTDATSQNVTSLKGLFQGGQGSTASSSQNASISCASTAATNLDCQAATLGGVNANNPYTSSITSSTMYQTSVGVIQAQKDASTAASTVGGLGGGVGQTCVTDTVTTPPVSETETCTVYMNPAESSCTVNQVVQVDADYLYQCEKKSSKDVGHTCGVGDVVVVDPDYDYGCQVKMRTQTKETCNKILTVTCQKFNPPPCGYPEITWDFSGMSPAKSPIVIWNYGGSTSSNPPSTDIGPVGYGMAYLVGHGVTYLTLGDLSGFTEFTFGVNGGDHLIINGVDINNGVGGSAYKGKAYLVEGKNTLQVTGTGQGGFGVSTTVSWVCPPGQDPICTDTWDDSSCQALAARH